MTAEDLLRRTLRYLQKTDAVNTLAEDIEKYLEEPKDNFCDGNCTWLDHHPDCVYASKDEPDIDSIDMQSRCRGDKE